MANRRRSTPSTSVPVSCGLSVVLNSLGHGPYELHGRILSQFVVYLRGNTITPSPLKYLQKALILLFKCFHHAKAAYSNGCLQDGGLQDDALENARLQP